jgi:hypothetical protein
VGRIVALFFARKTCVASLVIYTRRIVALFVARKSRDIYTSHLLRFLLHASLVIYTRRIVALFVARK